MRIVHLWIPRQPQPPIDDLVFGQIQLT